MRISPKQIMVKKFVKTRPSVLGKFCETCNHLVILEFMYYIPERSGYYCRECYSTKEELYDDVYLRETTASDIWLKNERKRVRTTLNNIINGINLLPDGEVSPSVHTIIMRYSIEAGLS